MGVCTLVLCSLSTVLSCIDPSVWIVSKSPKVGPLLMFSISLDLAERLEHLTFNAKVSLVLGSITASSEAVLNEVLKKSFLRRRVGR